LNEGPDLKEMVEAAYDDIAPHFAETRNRVWPPTKEFIREISPCRLADLGCGTGRALLEAALQGCTVVGIDSSQGQLDISREQIKINDLSDRIKLIKADLENLPIDNEKFDACIMIAALHHLPDRDSRIRALDEAWRCTRPYGKAQISVWTWDQDRFREIHISRISGDRDPGKLDGPLPGDIMVPWKKGTTALRFYHLYGPGELESEIDESRWTLQRSYFDGRNHWAECIKVP
jgi:SAM-dependent methyltransferase